MGRLRNELCELRSTWLQECSLKLKQIDVLAAGSDTVEEFRDMLGEDLDEIDDLSHLPQVKAAYIRRQDPALTDLIKLLPAVAADYREGLVLESGFANHELAQEQIRHACVVLNISEGATPEEIQTAYRACMKQYHPDKVAALGPDLQELAKRRTQQINWAYEVLTHASRRPPDEPRSLTDGASHYQPT